MTSAIPSALDVHGEPAVPRFYYTNTPAPGIPDVAAAEYSTNPGGVRLRITAMASFTLTALIAYRLFRNASGDYRCISTRRRFRELVVFLIALVDLSLEVGGNRHGAVRIEAITAGRARY